MSASEKRLQSVQLLVKASHKVAAARQAGERVLECVALQSDATNVGDVLGIATQGMSKALGDVAVYSQVKMLHQMTKNSEAGQAEEAKKPKDELWAKHNAVFKAATVHKRSAPALAAMAAEERTLFPMWPCTGAGAAAEAPSGSKRARLDLRGKIIEESIGSAVASTKLEVRCVDRSMLDCAAEDAVCLEALMPRVFHAVVELEGAGGAEPVRVSFYAEAEAEEAQQAGAAAAPRGGVGAGPPPKRSVLPGGASKHEVFRRMSEQGLKVIHALRQAAREGAARQRAAAAGGTDASSADGKPRPLRDFRPPALEQLLTWISRHDDVFTRGCSACGRMLAPHPGSRVLLPPYVRPLPAIRQPAWEKTTFHPQCVTGEYHLPGSTRAGSQ
mmetsp:Transcript_14049/g.44702  ORF Transcript_14049/g.44702 Transcript_14049/m.44702 type:complete len:387 (+) Transcript_14049:114-1274(+)